ncbi:MAG: hypothetical protein HC881_12740 [Leptolyngbyaceae cyanobacterium SL_7_1]|nr:hypothetical protein [Leptolyngbyaceae cyanobacterium SL_7_1]
MRSNNGGSRSLIAVRDTGLSAADRLKDLADVQELIRILNLPHDLTSQLNPSVQSKFSELWDGVDQARRDRSVLTLKQWKTKPLPNPSEVGSSHSWSNT